VYALPANDQTALPVGIAAPPFGVPFVGTRLPFNFITPIPASARGDLLHFQFTPVGGGQQLYPPGMLAFASGTATVHYSPYVRPPGLDATQWGGLRIANKSDLQQTVSPFGWTQLQLGRPAVGRSLLFKFGAPGYEAPTPLLPFDFINQDYGKFVFVFGSAHDVFGVPTLENKIRFLFPPGWDSLAFSPPVFEGGFARGVLPGGWLDEVFGSDPTIGPPRLYVRPYGILGTVFGLHDVGHRIRFLHAFGGNQLGMGRPAVDNARRDPLRPLGFSDEAIGEPSLRLTRQYIGVDAGIDSLTLAPAARVQDWMTVHSSIGPTQVVRPFDFGDVSVVGEPIVTFYLQYIRLPIDGPESTQWGEHTIDFRVKYIYVPWTYFTQMGRPQLGWTPTIKPPGIDSAEYGTPDIALGNVRQIQGFDSLEVSTPLARLMRLPIVVGEWDEKDKFGFAYVYNRTQIVYVDNKQYFDYAGPVSEYADVRNRSRLTEPQSWISHRIPNTHRARLTGQQTLPGMGEQTQWGEHMVAYRIRHVYPNTRYFFAGFVDPYHFVHNQATRIFIPGIDSLKIPALHKLWFNAQYIAPRYVQPDAAYGKPFVAWNPRYLQQFDAELGSVFGKAWVSNYIRPVVEPPWQVEYGFGTPVLYTHRNIITVFHIAYNAYGTPRVHNVTPELHPSMSSSMEFGQPWVSRAPRNLLPDVVLTTTFAAPLVMFRNRYVLVTGIEQTAIPMPTVREQYDVQIFDQTIWVYGIGPPAVPIPTVRQYPSPVGWDSLTFGVSLNVRLQGCSPYTGIPDSFFGFGIPIINKAPQVITEVNRNDDYGSQTGWSKPAASPFTIWAQTNPPEQARQNHPGPLFYELGALDNPPDYGLPPWFGHARVWGPGAQYVYPHHKGDSMGFDYTRGETFGPDTAIANTKHYIYPTAWDSRRFGFPTLPHSIKVWNFGWFDEVMDGVVTVSLRPLTTQYIRPIGIPVPDVVVQHVELKDRPIYPAGFSATVYGNNNPMVYHYPRGPNPVGDLDFTEFGEDTWISHSPRNCPIEGFESFDEGYTSGQFNDRMKVTRGQGHRVVSVGDELRMGVPDVSLGAGALQKIAPYMIPPPVLCHPHAIEEV
jgi:hypothetical protein